LNLYKGTLCRGHIPRGFTEAPSLFKDYRGFIYVEEVMDQVENAFGQTVSAPKLAWKPIAQMDSSERREYNRLRAADSRKKRKEKEELVEEKKRLEEQQVPKDDWDRQEMDGAMLRTLLRIGQGSCERR
jgi:hypothetical protein